MEWPERLSRIRTIFEHIRSHASAVTETFSHARDVSYVGSHPCVAFHCDPIKALPNKGVLMFMCKYFEANNTIRVESIIEINGLTYPDSDDNMRFLVDDVDMDQLGIFVDQKVRQFSEAFPAADPED